MPFIVNETISVDIRMEEVGSGDLLAVTLADGTCFFLEKKGDFHLGFCNDFMPREVVELSLRIAEQYSGVVTPEAKAAYSLRSDKSQRLTEFLASEMTRDIRVTVVENLQTPTINIGRTLRVYYTEPGFESARTGWRENWTASSRIVSIKAATYSDAELHYDFIGARA